MNRRFGGPLGRPGHFGEEKNIFPTAIQNPNITGPILSQKIPGHDTTPPSHFLNIHFIRLCTIRIKIQMQQNAVARLVGLMGKKRNSHKILAERPKAKEPLVVGREILQKCISKKWIN
jgi:hypothetical protein